MKEVQFYSDSRVCSHISWDEAGNRPNNRGKSWNCPLGVTTAEDGKWWCTRHAPTAMAYAKAKRKQKMLAQIRGMAAKRAAMKNPPRAYVVKQASGSAKADEG